MAEQESSSVNPAQILAEVESLAKTLQSYPERARLAEPHKQELFGLSNKILASAPGCPSAIVHWQNELIPEERRCQDLQTRNNAPEIPEAAKILGGIITFVSRIRSATNRRFPVLAAKKREEIDCWATEGRRLSAHIEKMKELLGIVEGEDLNASGGLQSDAEDSGTDVARRLLSVFTEGMTDERFENAANLLNNEMLSVNDKLWKLDNLIPIPSTISAEKLGKLFKSKDKPDGVSKTAIQNTAWYKENRHGKRDEEIFRRHEKHRKRSNQCELNRNRDDEYLGN